MNRARLPLTIAAALWMIHLGVAAPQGSSSYSTSEPWLEMNLDHKKKIKLSLSNASFDAVIKFLGNTSGITIVKDPTLTGTVSLTTSKPVSLAQAFSMLNALLEMKGFELQSRDTFLVIKAKPKTTARGGPMGFMGSGSMTSPMAGGSGTSPSASRITTELRVYMLQFASASSVAKTINDVFANVQNSTFGQGMFGDMPPMGGGPGGRGPLADALADPQPPMGGGGPGGMMGGPGGMQGGPGGMMGGFGQGSNRSSTSQSLVKASADEYSNTVIVNAPSAYHTQIAFLIKQIDVETPSTMTTEVYYLAYALASDLTTPVQSVLSANATKGKGSTSSSTSPMDTMFGNPFSSRSSSTSGGVVTADTRSNSLMVTTTAKSHALISKLLTKIDKEFPTTSASEVIPLANARATDMADLLNDSFGSSRSSSSRRTSSSSSSSSNRTTTTNNRSNSNNNNNNRNLFGQDQNLYVKMDDPEAQYGDLATDVTIGQGGFGFGGTMGQTNRSSSSSSSSTTAARDKTGKVINITDISGKVTIVADSNTNSLIVVGDPDAVELLKQIIEKLDRIPEQVMIETMIVEASLDATEKFGLEWSIAQNKAFGNNKATGTATTNFDLATSATTGFKYTLSGGDLTGFLNAFKTDTKFRVLSTPRIFTSNNTEATINISQSIPYVTSTEKNTDGSYIYNYSFQDVGIVLTVTPRISPSGSVTLDVEQTANDLQGYTSFNAPIVNQREANTTISVKDGETIVLGGIMRSAISSTTNKVPLLGDIPLLGNLFRSKSKTENKTELLVFLTPKIVHNSDDAKKIYDQQTKSLSTDLKKEMKK